MEVLFVLIPVSIALAAASVTVCLVAIRAGQYDDMESPRWRMLFDDARAERATGSGAEPRGSRNDVDRKTDANQIARARRSDPT